MPKEQSESVNRRGTDNTFAKKKLYNWYLPLLC